MKLLFSQQDPSFDFLFIFLLFLCSLDFVAKLHRHANVPDKLWLFWKFIFSSIQWLFW